MVPTPEKSRRGRLTVVGLCVALIASVFLRMGEYHFAHHLIRVNGLSSTFGDFGVAQLTFGAIVLIEQLAFARSRVRPMGYALTVFSMGLVGFVLPDIWTRNIVTVLRGTVETNVSVRLVAGFWFNLVLVVLVCVSSFVLVSVEHSSRVSLEVTASRSAERRVGRTLRCAHERVRKVLLL